MLIVLSYSVFSVHHIFFLHIFTHLHICIFLCSVVLCNRWPALIGESLFLAACYDYVLSVYLLFSVFVWQNKISSSSFPSPSFSSPLPFFPLPFSLFPFPPLKSRRSWEHWKLSQQVRMNPGHQMHSGRFEFNITHFMMSLSYIF